MLESDTIRDILPFAGFSETAIVTYVHALYVTYLYAPCQDACATHDFMSGVHYAQYFITWQFAHHQGVTVRGQGNLLSLEGAEPVVVSRIGLGATRFKS